MISVLAFLGTLSLSPAQAPKLEITDVTPRHGLLGPVREKGEVQVGDVSFLSWTIKGLQPDKNGKVTYTVTVELKNEDGEVVFRQEPREASHLQSLGGNQVKGFFTANVGLNTPTGNYSAKITVTDVRTKASTSVTGQVKVVKGKLGIVRLFLSHDLEGNIPATPKMFVSQGLQIHYSAIGFGRKDGKPNVVGSLEILQDGKPVKEKPLSAQVTAAAADDKVIPFTFGLNLNRAGKFTVRLKIEDKVNNETATLSFPLTVEELSK